MDGRRVLLVDFPNLFMRSWHGLKAALTSEEGRPTWGIHGSISTFAAHVRRTEPTHLLLALDSRPSWRRAVYPAYKAGRRTDDPERADAHSQMDESVRLLEMLGVAVARSERAEADDVIAAAVLKLPWAAEDRIEIMSGDKDLRQLVSGPSVSRPGPEVVVLSPGLGTRAEEKVWDDAAVVERYGVSPRQLADVMALMGDVTDGVPGVKGIGEKRAAALIQKWGSAPMAVLEDPRLDGHGGEVAVAHRLVVLDGSHAEPPSIGEMEFRPVGPGDPGAPLLRRDLLALGMEQVVEHWLDGVLWRESTLRKRALATA